MYVIQRHGKTAPKPSDLKTFQLGYDYSENKFGKHEGETLFIKKDDNTVVDITKNYLKTEFVDYILSGKDSNGKDIPSETVYTHDNKLTHGIVMDLQRDLKTGEAIVRNEADGLMHKGDQVYDDTGVENAHMGEVVNFGGHVLNPVTGTYNEINFSINSVDFNYLQDLRNSLEQKALIVVDTVADAVLTAGNMAKENIKTLEDGVQFLVKNDERHTNETYLWVVSSLQAGEAIEDGASAAIIPGVDNKVLKSTIPLEYKYHDPNMVDADVEDGHLLKLEIVAFHDDKASPNNAQSNTVDIRFTKHTATTIVNAFNEAIEGVTFEGGKTAADLPGFGDVALAKNYQNTETFTPVDGQTYQNYLALTHKIYDDEHDTYDKVTHYIDFNNFVLDEGTWDPQA